MRCYETAGDTPSDVYVTFPNRRYNVSDFVFEIPQHFRNAGLKYKRQKKGMLGLQGLDGLIFVWDCGFKFYALRPEEYEPFRSRETNIRVGNMKTIRGIGGLPPPAVTVDECWFCGLQRSDEKKLYICGKCASEKRVVKALYCSRTCQKKHWHDHKKEHK